MPLSVAELAALNLPSLRDEEFGPGTDRPWLAIDLTGASDLTMVQRRLAALPCPVIGVVSAPVDDRWKGACDVLVNT